LTNAPAKLKAIFENPTPIIFRRPDRMTLAQKLENWLESPFVHNAILAVILINAAILGLETSPTVVSATGNLLSILDEICLGIFICFFIDIHPGFVIVFLQVLQKLYCRFLKHL
jgi:hypothetical protein